MHCTVKPVTIKFCLIHFRKRGGVFEPISNAHSLIQYLIPLAFEVVTNLYATRSSLLDEQQEIVFFFNRMTEVLTQKSGLL